jgi:hypothetical protein
VGSFDSEDLLHAYAERTDVSFPAPDHPMAVKGFRVVARIPGGQYRVFAYTREGQPRHPATAAVLSKRG